MQKLNEKKKCLHGIMTLRKRVIFKATDNFDKFTFMAMKIIVKLAAEVFKEVSAHFTGLRPFRLQFYRYFT